MLVGTHRPHKAFRAVWCDTYTTSQSRSNPTVTSDLQKRSHYLGIELYMQMTFGCVLWQATPGYCSSENQLFAIYLYNR